MASIFPRNNTIIFLAFSGAIGNIRSSSVAKTISKGNDHYRRGELAEAARCYNQAIKMDPKNPVAWNNKGLILAIAGKYEAALDSHSKAVELDEDYVDAISNIGMAYTKLGKFNEALTYYNLALEKKPGHDTTWNNKGNLLAKMDKHAEAMECYDRALEINPHYMAVMNNKAVELIHLKRYDDSLLLLNKVLKERPLFAEGWYVKGKAYIGMRLFEKAIVCLERAHRLDSEFHQAKRALDVLKKKMVEPPGAKAKRDKRPRTEREIKKLEDKIEKDLMQATSEVEILSDEFKHQEEHLTKEEITTFEFIGDVPISKTALKRKLGSRLSQMAMERGLEGLEREGLIESKKAGRGFTFVKTGALGALEEERIEEPTTESVEVDTKSATDFHGLIAEGRKLVNMERHREALSKFRRALIINPYDQMAICLKAQSHYELGDRDKAINTISQILNKEPDFVPAWFTLANVSLKYKEYTDAADCFRKILELQPDNQEAKKCLDECVSKI